MSGLMNIIESRLVTINAYNMPTSTMTDDSSNSVFGRQREAIAEELVL